MTGRFLSMTKKDDVKYHNIPLLARGTDADSMTLARYAYRDSLVTDQLQEKFSFLINAVSMARVVGVNIDDLWRRGQQHKTMSLLRDYCKASGQGYLMATRSLQDTQDQFSNHSVRLDDAEDGTSIYEGALVIDPIIGFYKSPIATLDFTSLYPSIMLAHNLSYETWIARPQGFVHPSCATDEFRDKCASLGGAPMQPLPNQKPDWYMVHPQGRWLYPAFVVDALVQVLFPIFFLHSFLTVCTCTGTSIAVRV